MSSARTSWCAGIRSRGSPRDAPRPGPPRASPTISPRAPARAAVDQVDDVADRAALDRGVRLLDERARAIPDPVVAARLPARAVHPLLHDHPGAVVGDDEAVQVEVEAVLHRGAVDLGDEAAGAHQRGRVQPDALADRGQLVGRAARMRGRGRRRRAGPARARRGASPRFSAPITLVVIPDECQSIPITAPNDWNQNGLRQPPQHLGAAVLVGDRLDDHRGRGAPSATPARPARARREAEGQPCRWRRACEKLGTSLVCRNRRGRTS